MSYTNFSKGPTTYFNSDNLVLSSEYSIDQDDIIILLENRGVIVEIYDCYENTFYINRMYVKGHGHKNIIKDALQSLYHKLDIISDGTAVYSTDTNKKLTISTTNKLVEVEFSKPKKKKKKI